MADYERFVVVAEDEWKLHCTRNDVRAEFSAKFGGLEWECTVEKGKLNLLCKDFLKGRVAEVHFELSVFKRYAENENFKPHYKFPKPVFVVLNRQNNGWSWKDAAITPTVHRLLIIRVLKERNQLPDFTLDQPIGRFKNDKQLRVGEHIFHVNKQLLSLLSPYFDGLFNSSYVEARQDEIDTGETDPALYHDILLALTAPLLLTEDVLPNRENIAGMMRLAKYYQADRLLTHCERHLRMCREMPTEERMTLAKMYGSKELQVALLFDTVTQDETRVALSKFVEE